VTATSNAQIIAAVATLTAEMKAVNDGIARVEAHLTTLEGKVTDNDDWIKARKRDGFWLSGALIGLGSIGAWVLNKVAAAFGY
jgi:hypothetical protein